MSKVEHYIRGPFEHGQPEDEIEAICVQNPKVGENVSCIALRFISEKGLSEEFARILEQIDAELEAENEAAPSLG